MAATWYMSWLQHPQMTAGVDVERIHPPKCLFGCCRRSSFVRAFNSSAAIFVTTYPWASCPHIRTLLAPGSVSTVLPVTK